MVFGEFVFQMMQQTGHLPKPEVRPSYTRAPIPSHGSPAWRADARSSAEDADYCANIDIGTPDEDPRIPYCCKCMNPASMEARLIFIRATPTARRIRRYMRCRNFLARVKPLGSKRGVLAMGWNAAPERGRQSSPASFRARRAMISWCECKSTLPAPHASSALYLLVRRDFLRSRSLSLKCTRTPNQLSSFKASRRHSGVPIRGVRLYKDPDLQFMLGINDVRTAEKKRR